MDELFVLAVLVNGQFRKANARKNEQEWPKHYQHVLKDVREELVEILAVLIAHHQRHREHEADGRSIDGVGREEDPHPQLGRITLIVKLGGC